MPLPRESGQEHLVFFFVKAFASTYSANADANCETSVSSDDDCSARTMRGCRADYMGGAATETVGIALGIGQRGFNGGLVADYCQCAVADDIVVRRHC